MVLTGISELAFVRQAMSAVMINWYSIGLHWGIHVDVLDQIKANHRKDLDACFTSAIAEWLTNYNPLVECGCCPRGLKRQPSGLLPIRHCMTG